MDTYISGGSRASRSFALDAAWGKATYAREFVDYARRAYQSAKHTGASEETLRRIHGSLWDCAQDLIGDIQRILDGGGLSTDLVTVDLSELEDAAKPARKPSMEAGL